LLVNGRALQFDANDLLVVPPASHCVIKRDGSRENTYLYFNFAPGKSDQDLYAIPIITPMGEEGPTWELQFRRALNQLIVTRTSLRAVVWSWLWTIAVPERSAPRNPYVQAAVRIFEDRMDESLSVTAVARECHLSSSQLNRLFLSEHGRTPMQFLLELRAAKAHHLLTQTTLPIKAVAAACGITNPHAFNRFVRARLGASPRSIRLGTAAIDTFRIANMQSHIKR